MKELVTRQEAAQMLGVSKTMIDIYKGKGYLSPVSTREGRIYFRKDQVQALKRLRLARIRKQAKKKSQMKATGQTKGSHSETPNNQS